MACKLPQSPSLPRSGPRQRPKKRIYVYCEGRTEKEYLDAFWKAARNPRVEVDCVGEVGVPFTVVEKAKKKLKDLKRAAKKSGSSFDVHFGVRGIRPRRGGLGGTSPPFLLVGARSRA